MPKGTVTLVHAQAVRTLFEYCLPDKNYRLPSITKCILISKMLKYEKK